MSFTQLGKHNELEVSLTGNTWDQKHLAFHTLLDLRHNEIRWGKDPSLNTKFVCFASTLYAELKCGFGQCS